MRCQLEDLTSSFQAVAIAAVVVEAAMRRPGQRPGHQVAVVAVVDLLMHPKVKSTLA